MFDFDIDELIYLSGVNINKMTTRQLRKYISRGLKFINEEDYMSIEDSDIERSFSMMEEDLGTYRGRIVGRTSRARKEELIDKATDIMVHLRTTAMEYGVSEEDIQLREQSEKAYEQLKKTFDNKNMTRKEFEDIVNTFGALGDSVLEKYVMSKEIYNVFVNVFNSGSSYARSNLQSIMTETYKELEDETKGSGMTKDSFTQKFVEQVLEKLKSYY